MNEGVELFSREFEISGRTIGPDHPVFVIAEAGVNHNGDLDTAIELVRRAKSCGADGVKFQTFRAEDLAIAGAPKARYQTRTTSEGESQLEMLKGLELPREWHPPIAELCREIGIVFLSTPYSTEDADFLYELGIGAFKIPSALIVEPFLLAHIAKKGLPIILSTGMATMGEIDDALQTLAINGCHDVILLQCHSEYPTRVRDANLRAMRTMERAFGVQVGFSDHTESLVPAVVAVALGARVIEKHFTLDRTLPGPDHTSSADPSGFATYVEHVRLAVEALGDARKAPTEQEIENRVAMRRSIVAAQRIEAGEILQDHMLTVKRPGDGLAPALRSLVVGKRAARGLDADTPLTLRDVEWPPTGF
jgi:N-acetylneuraminate synthase/N,N'-diacetyllegionaminate synthase